MEFLQTIPSADESPCFLFYGKVHVIIVISVIGVTRSYREKCRDDCTYTSSDCVCPDGILCESEPNPFRAIGRIESLTSLDENVRLVACTYV